LNGISINENIRKDDIFCLPNDNWNEYDEFSTTTIEERSNLVLFSKNYLPFPFSNAYESWA
jgi:hypothetical protein